MKFTTLITHSLLLITSTLAYGEGAPVRRPMALMVFFDGGRADCMDAKTCPNLWKLIDGTWAEGYRCAWSEAGQNIFDAYTLSYPNHCSILCGVTAAKHHVLNNDQVLTKGDKHGWPTWGARLAKARPGLKVHAFFSDENDVRIMPDEAVSMTVAKDDERDIDELTAAAAVAAYSGSEAPDAGLVFLNEPDSSGHCCGYYPTSEAYLAAYHASDEKLGRVLDAIRKRPTFTGEDWLIVFTTDHGGKFLGHGPDNGHCHTVPVVVAGRHVAHGRLPGCPRTYDLAPTLLAHFGVGADGMDGRVIGAKAASVPALPLTEGLFFYEPFEKVPPRRIDVGREDRVTSRWGYADCVLTGLTAASAAGAAPISPSYGRVRGDRVPAAFRLGGTASVFAGAKPSFTLAFWMLDDGRAYAEDPIVLGNKNIYSFINHGFSEGNDYPGFAIFLRTKSADGSRGVTLKVTKGDALTMRTLGAFSQEFGQWNFYALSVHPDGKALFYQGLSNGRLHWMAMDGGDALWDSGGPLLVGQDVTGQYADGADLCFDELRLWSRALTTDEVREAFGRR